MDTGAGVWPPGSGGASSGEMPSGRKTLMQSHLFGPSTPYTASRGGGPSEDTRSYGASYSSSPSRYGAAQSSAAAYGDLYESSYGARGYGEPLDRSVGGSAGGGLSRTRTSTGYDDSSPYVEKGASAMDIGNAPPVESLYNWVKAPSDVSTAAGADALTSPVGTRRKGDSPSYFGESRMLREEPFFEEEAEAQGGGLTGNWITVFGFSPSLTTYILKHFQNYGEIVRHHKDNAECNWIHIQYQTDLQKQKALSKNGKIIGGNLMVGVVESNGVTTALGGSTMLESNIATDFPRPLNPASQRRKPSSVYDVEIYGPKKRPQRQDSVWSKFVEYVIGS
ncbi:Nucleoporin nup35 [Balamuthia mandrillaris]